MRPSTLPTCLIPLILLLTTLVCSNACRAELDHKEFDATLYAPYRPDPANPPHEKEARTFVLEFFYYHVEQPQDVLWLLEVSGKSGTTVRKWHGVERLFEHPLEVKVRWDGRGATADLTAGIYTVRLRAISRPACNQERPPALGEDQVRCALALADSVIDQSWDVAIGAGPRASDATRGRCAARAPPETVL